MSITYKGEGMMDNGNYLALGVADLLKFTIFFLTLVTECQRK